MKKNKMSKLAIAAVASLAIATSGTFAWFVARTVAGAAVVDTAKIEIGGASLATVDAANKLPGEKVILNNGSGVDNTIENESTRPSIFKLSFTEATKGIIDPSRVGAATSSAKASDYVTDAAGLIMKATRLDQVVKMRMANLNSQWVEVTNAEGGMDYYLYVQEKAITPTVTVNEMTLELLGELGGNYKDPITGVRSVDRTWEQQSKFNTAYTITAVQASKQAVIDNYGQAAADAIRTAHGDAGQAGSWFMFQ